MSPESLSNRVYSEKSDVWAFGCTVLEILTEDVPFKNMELLQVATSLRDGVLTPLSEIPLDCPAYLREILQGCWKTAAENRLSFAEIGKLMDASKPDSVSDSDDRDREDAQDNFPSKKQKQADHYDQGAL